MKLGRLEEVLDHVSTPHPFIPSLVEQLLISLDHY
jgi:hypothetical protein